MIESGHVVAPGFFQLCLGIEWGAPARPEALGYMKGLLPAGAHWAAFGIARDQRPLIALSVLGGGHVRTGLEDISISSVARSRPPTRRWWSRRWL